VGFAAEPCQGFEVSSVAWFLQTALALLAFGSRPESTPERLHRRAMHCLEVLEREACAVENFEQLLDERDAPRELVGDALQRLLRIYARRGDDAQVRVLLRRYWDVGMKRRSLVHVPYSVRYFPAEIDVLMSAHLDPLTQAPVWNGIAFDVREFALTCDPTRREALIEAQRRRVAAERAAAEQRSVDEVLAERRAQAEAQRAAYERRASERPKFADPIFAEGTCAVARALGARDLRSWKTISGGFHHADPTRSVAAFTIPNLARALAEAVDTGRLVPRGRDHWRVPGMTYAGAPVDVVQLDRDELMLATAEMAEAALLARRQNRPRLGRALVGLIEGVPRDADALLVLTSEAAVGLGMQGLRESTKNVLQALLPRPKGVQIALQVEDQIAIFTRVPLDKGAQGRVLLDLARAALAQRGRKDPQLEAWLRNLDLAQANDRRALLATYWVTAAQVRDAFGG